MEKHSWKKNMLNAYKKIPKDTVSSSFHYRFSTFAIDLLTYSFQIFLPFWLAKISWLLFVIPSFGRHVFFDRCKIAVFICLFLGMKIYDVKGCLVWHIVVFICVSSCIFAILAMFLGWGFGYFFFTKREIFQNQLSWHNLVHRPSRLPSLFLVIACTVDVILPDIANVFQIWSALCVGIWRTSRGSLSKSQWINVLND